MGPHLDKSLVRDIIEKTLSKALGMARTIKPSVNQGRLRIRFNHKGLFHQIYIGPSDCQAARALATKICSEVYLEQLQGTFANLDKWKTLLGHSKDLGVNHAWLLEQRLAGKYSDVDRALIKVLAAFGKPIKTPKDAQDFVTYLTVSRKLKPSSIHRYLDTLKAIYKVNFGSVKAPRVPKKLAKPFSPDEVVRILDAFKSSVYYSHYYGYVLILFHTGMRPGEVIGLRWQDIDLSTREINVTSSLARGKSGRVRKTTKTGDERVVPMREEVYEHLLSLPQPLKCDELIFKSPYGLPISDQQFGRRAWRKCLETAGVPYRCPYTTRSTWITLMINAGSALASIAQFAGTSQEIILKHYSGAYASGVGIPKLF